LNTLITWVITSFLLLNSAAFANGDPLAELVSIGDDPQLLAPGFINTGLPTRDVAMSPDGREFYFCVNTAGYKYACIMETHFLDGAWTEPEVASFSGLHDYVDLEPALSPDGQKLFFYSTRPSAEGAEDSQDIWVVNRQENGWSEAENLGAPINTTAPEFFPSVTGDGTLYFCRADETTRRHSIFRSRFVDGKYQEPEKLPDEVNSGASQFNAWVSPDESRLIVPIAGHPDNRGGVDYWLCRRNSDDTWQAPVNLGPMVNDGSGQSWSPYVSPDEKYFFFMSSRSTEEPMPWPVDWSELQYRHLHPGMGRPGIFVMKAEFLNSLTADTVEQEEIIPTSSESLKYPPFNATKGRYFGQSLPGVDPGIFSPGVISTGLTERDIFLSADGRFLLFGLMDMGLVTTMVAQWQDDRWGEPATAPWHSNQRFACFEPTMSADGKSVLFLSNQAAEGQIQGRGWSNQNIFASHFEDGKWSEAKALPAPITTDAAEYFPSLAADGTLYFSREDKEGHPAIWMAAVKGDGFAEPIRLPDEVNVGSHNYNAFVDPDQSQWPRQKPGWCRLLD